MPELWPDYQAAGEVGDGGGDPAGAANGSRGAGDGAGGIRGNVFLFSFWNDGRGGTGVFWMEENERAGVQQLPHARGFAQSYKVFRMSFEVWFGLSQEHPINS